MEDKLVSPKYIAKQAVRPLHRSMTTQLNMRLSTSIYAVVAYAVINLIGVAVAAAANPPAKTPAQCVSNNSGRPSRSSYH